jgi:peptidoglycan lytic transglycosylase
VQGPVHHGARLTTFRHNLNTLKFDTYLVGNGSGKMRSGASAAFRRFAPVGVCAVLSVLLAHCSGGIGNRWGVRPSPRVIGFGEPIPKGGGVYMVGSPYTVGGRVYVPRVDPHYDAVGVASWYGRDFRGRYTANGEIYDLDSISAAHPTLPLPCYARVTNLSNGRSLIVRVNDRGPYVGNRIIDVSARAARLLRLYRPGSARVRVQYVGPAPLRGSDDNVLASTLREDEPAPLPRSVRLATGRIFPPAPRPVGTREVIASASAADPPPHLPATRTSDRSTRAGIYGTAQVLNGRGLY